MRLPDEPKGWSLLQEQLRRETDPQKIIGIIDRLNSLLDEHEAQTMLDEHGDSSAA